MLYILRFLFIFCWSKYLYNTAKYLFTETSDDEVISLQLFIDIVSKFSIFHPSRYDEGKVRKNADICERKSISHQSTPVRNIRSISSVSLIYNSAHESNIQLLNNFISRSLFPLSWRDNIDPIKLNIRGVEEEEEFFAWI